MANKAEEDRKENDCFKQSVAVRGGTVRRTASRADGAWSLELSDLRGRVFAWGKVEQYLCMDSATCLAWAARAFLGASLDATKRKLWSANHLCSGGSWRCGHCRLLCDSGAWRCQTCHTLHPLRQQQQRNQKRQSIHSGTTREHLSVAQPLRPLKRRQSQLSDRQYGRPFSKKRRTSAATAAEATFKHCCVVQQFGQSQRQSRCQLQRCMPSGGMCESPSLKGHMASELALQWLVAGLICMIAASATAAAAAAAVSTTVASHNRVREAVRTWPHRDIL